MGDEIRNSKPTTVSKSFKKKTTMISVKTIDNVTFNLPNDTIAKIPVLNDMVSDISHDVADYDTGSEPCSLQIDEKTLNEILKMLERDSPEFRVSILQRQTFRELKILANGTNYLGIDDLKTAVCMEMLDRIENMEQKEVDAALRDL